MSFLRQVWPLEKLCRGSDHGQQVIEIVRHAAGKLTHRLHLLRLAQLLFSAQPLLDGMLDLAGQRQVQLTKVIAGPFGRLTRLQQLLLVTPTIGRVENGHPDEANPSRVVAPLDRIDQNRQARAIGTDEIQSDLVEEPLQT